MENEIIKLRRQGKSYNQIQKITGENKSKINYYCKKYGLDGRIDGKDLKKINLIELKLYYSTHTVKETAEYFNIGYGSVNRLVGNKTEKLSDFDKKKHNYNHVKSFRKRNKEKAVEYMGGKCVRCNYNKCIEALEFHHKNPKEKDFSLSQNMNKAWYKIKKELDKCIMVCSNCHKEIHVELKVT